MERRRFLGQLARDDVAGKAVAILEVTAQPAGGLRVRRDRQVQELRVRLHQEERRTGRAERGWLDPDRPVPPPRRAPPARWIGTTAWIALGQQRAAADHCARHREQGGDQSAARRARSRPGRARTSAPEEPTRSPMAPITKAPTVSASRGRNSSAYIRHGVWPKARCTTALTGPRPSRCPRTAPASVAGSPPPTRARPVPASDEGTMPGIGGCPSIGRARRPNIRHSQDDSWRRPGRSSARGVRPRGGVEVSHVAASCPPMRTAARMRYPLRDGGPRALCHTQRDAGHPPARRTKRDRADRAARARRRRTGSSRRPAVKLEFAEPEEPGRAAAVAEREPAEWSARCTRPIDLPPPRVTLRRSVNDLRAVVAFPLAAPDDQPIDRRPLGAPGAGAQHAVRREVCGAEGHRARTPGRHCRVAGVPIVASPARTARAPPRA